MTVPKLWILCCRAPSGWCIRDESRGHEGRLGGSGVLSRFSPQITLLSLLTLLRIHSIAEAWSFCPGTNLETGEVRGSFHGHFPIQP